MSIRGEYKHEEGERTGEKEHLSNREFHNEADALKAAREMEKHFGQTFLKFDDSARLPGV